LEVVSSSTTRGVEWNPLITDIYSTNCIIRASINRATLLREDLEAYGDLSEFDKKWAIKTQFILFMIVGIIFLA
jgi:hypothetical protein